MKFEIGIEHQLNIFIDILTRIIDKGSVVSLETIEKEKEKKTLISYIVNKSTEAKDLIEYAGIDINSLEDIYSKEDISVQKIQDSGIKNNGLLYLIKVASNELINIMSEEEIIE